MPSNHFKKIAEKFRVPYEPGITRVGVLKKDEWTCKMEVCLYPDRQIDPTLRREDSGVIPNDYGSVDHIVPLAASGSPGHVWSNVRAAHRLCNRVDLARVLGFWATGDSALLSDRVDDRLPEELQSMRQLIRRVLQPI